MKKVLLTMASLMMLVSVTFAQDETPMLPEAHGLEAHQPAWRNSQTFDLSAGWNWWSTYINVSGEEGLIALENALGENGMNIKAVSAFVTNDAVLGWSGALTSVENTAMYAVQVASDAQITMSGSRANITQTPISVGQGWNWIGYPVNFETTVDYALSNYTTPQAGEMIKSNGPFATYDAVSESWVGTLTNLTPGNGYKMKILSSEAITYYYPAVPATSGREFVSAQIATSTEWEPQMSSNPDNMNMIAVVSLNGKEVTGEDVEIGAFNGEICRGAVRPLYVESLDRYFVFLTMYGENDEPYRFRMMDHETGAIYESEEVSVSFKADAVLGQLTSPFELKFNTNQGMTAGNLQLFPNPVNRGESVNLVLPENSLMVEVVNMLGSTVKTMRVAEGSNRLSADMTPGIYTVKVTDVEGNVSVDKLVVK